MAQESRVQKAIQEQEKQFGKITRSISGTSCTSDPNSSRDPPCPASSACEITKTPHCYAAANVKYGNAILLVCNRA